MTLKTLTTSLAWGLVMAAVTSARVVANETEPTTFNTSYSGTISGSATSTQIDAINPGDGVKGNLVTFGISTRELGQITGQALVEDTPATTPSGICPEGTDAEFALGTIQATQRFRNGDLLYLNALTRTGCFDFDQLSVHSYETGEMNGGTGQFAQAKGLWKITSTAKILTIDPEGRLFGPFSGKFSGTIITPAPLNIKQ